MRHRLAVCPFAVAAGTGTTWAQTPAGGEFRVNVATTGVQTNPSVALDASGNFVIGAE